jgi:hypothetical protein
MTATNTIGTVRVACSNATTVTVPVAARMTSGASATNSAACLRMSSGLVVAQRVSIRTLRPSAQPNCCKACRNPAMRACDSESSAAEAMSTPMRRMRSGCSARATSGQLGTEPTRSVMNSRRRIETPEGTPHQ